jgi:hypothetical protein
VNAAAYGATWRTVLNVLGPGENTSDTARVDRRRSRRPTTAEKFPSALTSRQTDALESAHAEIADVQYSYRSQNAPTIPGTLAAAPNVLTPRQFGIYEST